jgi:hypothetical protein
MTRLRTGAQAESSSGAKHPGKTREICRAMSASVGAQIAA